MKKIFIVDDEPHVGRVLRLYLQNAGYEVHFTCDSSKAVEKFMLVKPDMLITDVKMPRLNGVELIKEIRNMDNGVHIPVILMTSSLSHEYMKWADEEDNVCFIGKPVSPRNLVNIINSQLRCIIDKPMAISA